MQKTSTTQCAGILKYLQAGNTLTPVEAQVNFGSFRLAARIKDLRQKGYPIVTEVKVNPVTKAKYASYKLSSMVLREGSRVRMKDRSSYVFEGATGTVLLVRQRLAFVRWESGRFTGSENGTEEWYARLDSLEVIS